jgi:hypothetical protein
MNNPVGETTGAAIKNSPEGMSYFIQSVLASPKLQRRRVSRLDKRNEAL